MDPRDRTQLIELGRHDAALRADTGRVGQVVRLAARAGQIEPVRYAVQMCLVQGHLDADRWQKYGWLFGADQPGN